MKKKSYNAFRMAGSWIGLLASIMIFFILVNFDITAQEFFMLLFWQPMGWIGYNGSVTLYVIMIAGFQVGWGLHSLIRKVRK